jgi:formylglycine-generating enzyme required for sulfatase activity
MVSVPEGAFTMGCSDVPANCMTGELDRPPHSVWLSAFSIDKTEVTRRAYQACANARACAPIPLVEDAGSAPMDALPVTGVSWEDARSYCAWVGKRLPTEAEWEKAARGSDERHYPWGEGRPRCDLANFGLCGGALRPAGSLPSGASPYGALDMTGNAEEWVNDWFGSSYYQASPERDPRGPTGGYEHVVRGGSYRDDWWHSGATVRMWGEAPAAERGFRCAKSR